MAVAAGMDWSAKPSLNPLKCEGTPLPVPLLLMTKLVALCILLSQEWRSFPDPFLPFIPALGRLAAGPFFRWSLKAVFLTASASLLLNRRVRGACLVIGSVFVIAVLSSRVYFANNRLFVGCLFFLAGLTEPQRAPWLLRWQVVLLYFSAGLNKLLDAGWRSGAFFATWGAHFIKERLYFRVEAWLPGMALARAFSWSTIAGELGLSASLLTPWSANAIWAGVLFHTGLLFLTGRTFGLFYYAALASYLAFVEWPHGPVTVMYDDACAFCASARRFFEAIDMERFAEWVPLPPGDRLYGRRERGVKNAIRAAIDTRVYAGFAALRILLLYNPVTYFVIAALLVLPEPSAFPYRRWLTVLLWIIFAPFFTSIAERAYDAIAAIRGRLAVPTQTRVLSARGRRG
jgi:hypothetical protein